ncbi:hypothetical protein PCK1_000096 [Pneumocystis canis]|nr:hypothetical protein PCK1_000096 [Pneumocystis canis]
MGSLFINKRIFYYKKFYSTQNFEFLKNIRKQYVLRNNFYSIYAVKQDDLNDIGLKESNLYQLLKILKLTQLIQILNNISFLLLIPFFLTLNFLNLNIILNISYNNGII